MTGKKNTSFETQINYFNSTRVVTVCIYYTLLLILLFTGAYSPGRTFGLPFRGFLITHIQTHGRTPLDE
jgi:hypothetical protein